MAIYQKSSGDRVVGSPKPCSRCGCNDTKTVGNQKFCRHCGKPWVVHLVAEPDPEPESGVHHVVRCDNCRSDKVKVTRTATPVRYYKCKDCGCNFKKVWV